MGQLCSTLKVSAHLEVVGQCGGADRLTLCLPRSRGKEGRRLLGAFSFPSGVDGAGHYRSACRTLVPIGRVAKKDGATPVRVDFLAGMSLVARREIPLADLLAGLKTNTIGRCSSLFFSLKAEDAVSGAAGEKGQSHVAVFYSGRLLDEPKTTQKNKEDPAETEQHASLPPQAGETNPSLSSEAGNTKLSLPPYAVYTNASKIVATEVTYSVLIPKVTVINLLHGRRWAAPQAQPRQEEENTSQAVETTEIIHRDLGDGQRWAAPQAQPRQEMGHTSQAGETPEVIHCDLGDGQRWAASQAQLRHRSSSVGAREGVVMQPSILTLSKQEKETQRDSKGSCLVNSALQYALAMAFTVVMYKVSLEWF
ncbi:hypothetical protein E2C01_068181 [Portunus trituberculatus]|uniref:Uncharacterized protein n=1 Tax=Portunus trituberculatus TaxID=210409 RepID=A0A5B7HLS4_PORTR|nr:hypothetical protein [Portunus trituberculatus]